MKLKHIPTFIALFFLSFTSLVTGQDMAFYCDVMANAYEASHRQRAAEVFHPLLLSDLQSPNSFSRPYEALKWVSVLYAPDSTFRLISYPVKGEEFTEYFGYVQLASGQIFPLKDKSRQLEDIEYASLPSDLWFGALYYNIIPSGNPNEYLLFGFNGFDSDSQIKLIDVIRINEAGVPVFGAPVFKTDTSGSRAAIKSRIIIDYSDKANVNCNFNESLGMIVHDFVVGKFGISDSGKPVKIPDGTYVAYEWKDGYWNKIDQLAHQVSSPESIYYQPKPKENKDLFGRNRGGKK